MGSVDTLVVQAWLKTDDPTYTPAPLGVPTETLHALGIAPGGAKLWQKMEGVTERVVSEYTNGWKHKLRYPMEEFRAGHTSFYKNREPARDIDYSFGSTAAFPYFKERLSDVAKRSMKHKRTASDANFWFDFDGFCIVLWLWSNPVLHLKGLITQNEYTSCRLSLTSLMAHYNSFAYAIELQRENEAAAKKLLAELDAS